MEGLGQVTLKTLNLFGLEITYNPVTFAMTFFVMGLILIAGYVVRGQLKQIPGFGQSVFEMIYDFLSEITLGTLGEKDGKRHLPFIVTLFIFILTANWIGIIPNLFKIVGSFLGVIAAVFSSAINIDFKSILDISLMVPNSSSISWLLTMPGFEEPTRSVNTDLALALLVFFIVQAYGIKNKGFFGYLKSYYNDPFPMKGWRALFFFVNPFFYLNLIGAVANVVSHSFRLFGNMFGGGMIIVIVSSLLKFFLVPVGLFAFFGIFAGLVQAFVFTMLAVTYIQQQQ